MSGEMRMSTLYARGKPGYAPGTRSSADGPRSVPGANSGSVGADCTPGGIALRPHLDAQAQQAAGQLPLGGMDGDAT